MADKSNYFLAKYCLTTGIVRFLGEPSIGVGDRYIVYRAGNGIRSLFLLDIDCFTTLEAAKIKAEAMRQARIASLKKSLAKLEKLSFAEPKVKSWA